MNTFTFKKQRVFIPLSTLLLITACGGSSKKIEVDTTPPATPTITKQTTETLTPTITGTFDASDSEGGLVVTVNNVNYTLATDNALTADGDNWQLIIPNDNALALGSYDIRSVSVDAADNSATDNTTDELIVEDITPPTAPAVENQTVESFSPTIIGTFDASDSEGGLVVTVNDVNYTLATDNALTADGDNWQLIIPNDNALALGSYDIKSVSTDVAGNSATDNTIDELIVADLTAPTMPTVVSQTVENFTPTIVGTFDESDRAGGFVVTVNAINYTFVTDGPLTNDGSNWQLIIPNDNALAFGSYDIIAVATDGAGNSASDSSNNEVIITDLTAPTVMSVSPSDAATTIALNARLVAQFDEAMNSASINTNSFTLYSSSAISGSIIDSQNDNTATFTPDTSLSLATTYTATLTTAIKDLYDNTIASNYSWLFTTRDGSWSAPETISNDDDNSAAYPRVIFDSAGNAVSVWRQYDGIRHNIWGNSYSPSAGWATPQLVEVDDQDNARNVEIAINKSGRAIATWQQGDGVNENIWVSFYAHNDGWTTPATIESNTGYAGYPKPVIDNQGNATVAWQHNNGLRNSIWANRYTLEAGWATAQIIENDVDSDSNYANPAIDAEGSIIVVWQKGGVNHSNIWSNRYDIINGWGTAELLETSDSGSAYYPRVNFDASGNAIAIWQQKENSKYDVWVRHYIKGDGWQPRIQLDTNETYSAREPELAVAENGDAIAIWQEEPNGIQDSIFVSHYTSGESWGVPVLIENYTNGRADYPEIAIDKNGNAIAAWQQRINDNIRHVAINRYVVSEGWGAAQLIEDNTTHSISYPRIAFGPIGNAIVTWYEDDGVNNNIWLAHFD